MEIQDAEVQWHEDQLNDPELILYVDETPDRPELEYHGSKESGLWYAEHESGYVDFFSWSGGQGDGYSGRSFDIQTVDGDEVTLKGPGASRAGVLNKAGYGPCLDVVYYTDSSRDVGEAGAVTLETAEDVVDRYLEDVELERVEKFKADEPYYVPQKTSEDTNMETGDPD